ncbi:MAG: hypothetical protein DME54_11905 [Verrucomicrobia bacterium]|nr:MAG: hypothetical protein DME54_11905 [Verrucomicrobiota bacterium]PYL20695.1 MAG: hypothetical protein DMF41_05225 [Verrucomicrobiota bacterium]
MKISSMIKSAAVLLILSVAASTAFAGPQRVEQVVVPPPAGEHYAYVWVTGSRLPQRVKISPVGTLTFNSLTVWDRRQINQVGPGRFTAEGVLRLDPAVTVRMGRAGGGF